MTKEDIIGGLFMALQKGESLERAMMTFFNAGYKKEDIEAAARDLYSQKIEQQPRRTINPLNIIGKPVSSIKKTLQKPLKPISESTRRLMSVQQTQIPKQTLITPQPTPKPDVKLQQQTSPSQQIPKPSPIQPQKQTPNVSEYERKKRSPRTILIIVLSVLLGLLILSLLGVFIFRNALIGIFNNLF
jgi:hypothetical protein